MCGKKLALKKKAVLETSQDYELIQTIITKYHEAKKFFSNESLRRKEANKYHSKLVDDFMLKFKGHPNVEYHRTKEKMIRNREYILIKTKEYVYNYPHEFSVLMDRTQDPNIITKDPPNLTIIEEYFETITPQTTLKEFFEGYFHYSQQLLLRLRRREVAILQLLASKEFLKDKEDGPRIEPPTDTDVLEALGTRKKKLQTIRRALTLLYGYSACSPTETIFNMSKLGFTYHYVEVEKESDVEQYEQFLYWKIPFERERYGLVLCLPTNSARTILKSNTSVELRQLFWNLDMSYFSEKSKWIPYSCPNLVTTQSITEVIGYRSWDITPSPIEVTEEELPCIKTLTTIRDFTGDVVDDLEEKYKDIKTRELLTRMVGNDVFQLYPRFNHIGLDFSLFVRFSIPNNILFNNTINTLLALPESHIFCNQEKGVGIAYFKMPSAYPGVLINALYDLQRRFPEIKFEFSDMADRKSVV